jgi:hypothetical protein
LLKVVAEAVEVRDREAAQQAAHDDVVGALEAKGGLQREERALAALLQRPKRLELLVHERVAPVV